MGKVVTIHQPEHLPWLGYLHKMSLVDQYIILDSVQYEKNYFQNRNKLVDREGNVFWLTVPVLQKGHIETTIKDIKIDNTQSWKKKYWGRIQGAYCRHPYFLKYASELESIIHTDYEFLVDLNLSLFHFFRKHFSITTPFVRASELGVTGRGSELLLDLCLRVNGTSYLSGPSGRDYLDLDIFKKNNVEVIFHQFSAPEYTAPKFTPYLSALDLLMNHGEKSPEILFSNTSLYVHMPENNLDGHGEKPCH